MDVYRSMKLGYLRILALKVTQIPFELGESSQSVCVELLKNDLSGKLCISFRGVQMLRIANIHPGSLCFLEIVSLAGHQLEGIRYQVFNPEQDLTLSFYCQDFEVLEFPL
jgi:hypothetical protein